MEVEKFKKTHVCPKCDYNYFGIVINWENIRITSTYTCEGCNWSCRINYTSLSNSPVPSWSDQTEASSVQAQ